jgi:hypothetical protein
MCGREQVIVGRSPRWTIIRRGSRGEVGDDLLHKCVQIGVGLARLPSEQLECPAAVDAIDPGISMPFAYSIRARRLTISVTCSLIIPREVRLGGDVDREAVRAEHRNVIVAHGRSLTTTTSAVCREHSRRGVRTACAAIRRRLPAAVAYAVTGNGRALRVSGRMQAALRITGAKRCRCDVIVWLELVRFRSPHARVNFSN